MVELAVACEGETSAKWEDGEELCEYVQPQMVERESMRHWHK